MYCKLEDFPHSLKVAFKLLLAKFAVIHSFQVMSHRYKEKECCFPPTFFFIQFHNYTESTSQEPIA